MKYAVTIFFFCLPFFAFSQEGKLKNFRATNQRVALVNTVSEFLEGDALDRTLDELRVQINRYSRSYGSGSVSNFSLGVNPNQIFFKPASEKMDDSQKAFLQKAAKDNSVDIFVLGSLRSDAGEVATDLQLYDARIDTLSGVVSGTIVQPRKKSIEDLIFRLMNHMDRDGFVHSSPQDLLEKPSTLQTERMPSSKDNQEDVFSIDPSRFSGGQLAGGVSIGGEKTPFWETWWFWTILGSSVATAGGLTYYFLVVDKPPSKANLTFTIN